MFLTSYIFKSKAVRALKGNWQTALIVSFIAGLPYTLSSLLSSTRMPEVYLGMTFEELLAALGQIDSATLWLIAIVSLASFIVTPVLSVSCNLYFIKRIQGEELGVMGVFSRRKIFWRALWLAVVTNVRIFLWGLLFIVPGILAALRYAMAPFFLAENPELTATQAINKSKEVMADKKMSVVVLWLSFIGWLLMASVAQIMLLTFSVILGMVAYQFIDLFRVTYMNASFAAFYLAASRTEGIAKARKEADAFVREMKNRIPGERPDDEKDDEDTDNGDKSEEP